MPKIVDHEARREELLAATWRVIARVGLDAATTRLIAKEAGWSGGGFAHYFKNKDDILVSALDLVLRNVEKRALEHVMVKQGMDALRAVIQELLPLDDQRRLEVEIQVCFWGRMVVRERLAAQKRLEFPAWRDFVTRLLIQARDAGELAAEADISGLTGEVLAFIDGLSLQGVLYPDDFPPRRQVELVDAWFEAVRARGIAFRAADQ